MSRKERYNHFEYFENIARKLKSIKHSDEKPHFFRATDQDEPQDLEQRLSSASGMLLIAIDGAESTFGWKISDSLMEQPLFHFAIVEQTEIGNSSTIFNAQSNCKKNAMQVIARMMNDYHNHTKGMDLLDPASFTMQGFGPIRNSFYGVMVDFSFEQGVDYTINDELWD